MATRSVRVFITDARLSYPALDEPKETMAGNGDLKYQATFLIAPDNPCVAKIKDAIKQIAIAEYGDKAKAVVTNREKIPLKKGDDKENIPDGYAGMLYISAKSKNRPELRDANPKIRIIEKEEIREKFTAGYRVNAYVDLYPYAVRNSGGAIIKSGIAAGLKGGAQAAGGERGGVRLALDQLFAGEIHDDAAVRCRRNKAIVLFCGDAGQRLEPVGIMGGTVSNGPVLHSGGNGIGYGCIQLGTLIDGLTQGLIDISA